MSESLEKTNKIDKNARNSFNNSGSATSNIFFVMIEHEKKFLCHRNVADYFLERSYGEKRLKETIYNLTTLRQTD